MRKTYWKNVSNNWRAKMYEREEIKNMLDDYRALRNTLEELMPNADSNSIAQYGIEATLPKPQGVNNSKVESSVITREKCLGRNRRLLDKIEFIENYHEQITDDKDYCLISLMMLGKKAKETIEVMNVKRDEYFNRKKKIIDEMYEMQFDETDCWVD